MVGLHYVHYSVYPITLAMHLQMNLQEVAGQLLTYLVMIGLLVSAGETQLI